MIMGNKNIIKVLMGIRKLVQINLLQFCFYKCFQYLEKYNMSLILSKPKPMLISKWKWKVFFLKDASLNYTLYLSSVNWSLFLIICLELASSICNNNCNKTITYDMLTIC